MAQQTINIGTIADDGTGDTLRDGGDKINDNFTELYAGLTGLLDFKGSTDCSANPNYPAASKGDYYLVSVAGKIGGASGVVVGVGDSYFATADNAGGTQGSVGASWTVVEGNIGYAPVNKAGDTMTGDLIVPDEAYDATAWDGSLEVPTKNAVRDKIEAVVAGGGSFTAASTTEQLTGTDSAKGSTSDSVAALWEQGADVASAGTTSFGEGGYFHVTGTTTITDIDFATDKAGRKAWVEFTGILTLTHNASTLILPTGANITTAAGDTACFVSEGSDAVRCVAYSRASGAALTGGSSGAVTLISEVVTSGSQASVSFTSIAATYRDLVVVARGRGTTAATTVILTVRFNNDSGANYQYEELRYGGTASAIGQSTAQTSLLLNGVFPAATATASYAGQAEMRVFDYRGTTFFKVAGTQIGAHLATSANTNQVGVLSGQWNSASAITRLDVLTSAGGFVDGSVVSLYGVM